MNINSKAFAKPKLTKKQRKRKFGMNHATKSAFKKQNEYLAKRKRKWVDYTLSKVFKFNYINLQRVNESNFGY